MKALVSCPCPLCEQGADEKTRAHHEHLRALMARLDERQRRWVAGLEAFRVGHGGERLVATITGLDRKTVRRGRREVLANFPGVPDRRVRRAGAGRKATQKNGLASSLP